MYEGWGRVKVARTQNCTEGQNYTRTKLQEGSNLHEDVFARCEKFARLSNLHGGSNLHGLGLGLKNRLGLGLTIRVKQLR